METGNTQALVADRRLLEMWCGGTSRYEMPQELSFGRAAQVSLGSKWYQLSDLGYINPDGDGQPA